MRIGFIGLGQMGAPIAANLLKAGHALAVWNRSPDKAQPLVEQGARLAASPAEATADAEIVVTMLADDAAVEAVTFGEGGLLGAEGRPLHLSLSTISVALSDRLAAAHAAQGGRFVAAPVFGRPPAAEAARLFVAAAGAPEDLAACEPVFSAIGQRTFVVGERPSQANVVKLCGNFMILSAIEAMAEAMTLAGKSGVDKATLLEVLTGTLFDAPVYRTYGDIIANEKYRPAGFAAPLGLKDARLVGQAAEATRTPMPLLGVVRDHLLGAIALEGEDIDWSGLALAVERNAGVS